MTTRAPTAHSMEPCYPRASPLLAHPAWSRRNHRGTLMARKGDDTLGFVAWRRRSYGPHSPCWIVSIALKPEARGHGHGTEAQRQLTRYLFAHTQAHRIEAGTELTNVGEQRALEKAGFTREGVLRGGGSWLTPTARPARCPRYRWSPRRCRGSRCSTGGARPPRFR